MIAIIGAAKVQGADIEIPTIAEARREFDEWLVSEAAESQTGEMLIKRALGLKEG